MSVEVQSALSVVIAVAGLLFLLGFRRQAGAAVALATLGALVLGLGEDLTREFGIAFPEWAWYAFGTIAALMALQAVIRLVFGKGVADQVVGELLVRLLLGLALAGSRPFRWLRRLWGYFW